ncbi:UNVERIFIED_CONTAM: hypothetical protein K2H54_002101 [Gekko kuhli]
MADEPPAEDDGTVLSRYNFHFTMQKLESNISEQIQQAVQQAIKPLSEELKMITDTLSEVLQAAETALEGAVMAFHDVQQLQKTEDWARAKIMALENKLKEQKQKFRGLPKDVEEGKKIKTFIATWLAKSLDLEDNVAPFINKYLNKFGDSTK